MSKPISLKTVKIYENLKGYLSNLRTDMRKYGSRIRREEDENNLLEEYGQYMDNNEIYMIDLYNELGVNYSSTTDNLRNLFDIYIKMYFFHLSSDELKNIVNYVSNEKFDLAFIDGDHQPLPVLRDIKSCLSLNIPYILFDDIYEEITESNYHQIKYMVY